MHAGLGSRISASDPDGAPAGLPGDRPTWAGAEQPEFIFNSPEWAGIVSECYGFEDCTVRVGAAALPLFYSRSPLFGDKLVSAVFNTYASPIYATVEECAELVRRAIRVAEQKHARFLEIKSVLPLPASVVTECGLVTRHPYLETVIPLAPYEVVHAGFHRKFRRNLRTAYRRVETEGVRVVPSGTTEDLRAFHALLARRYRDKHLMIPQPFKLFELINTRFLAAGRGQLWVAKAGDGEMLGGLLFATHGDTVTGLFGAAVESYRGIPIDTVMKNEALRWYCDRGYRLCDLGITSPTQASLLFAKARFQGVTFPMPYYYFLVRARRAPEFDFADAYLWLRRPVRYVPVPVIRAASSLLARYLN